MLPCIGCKSTIFIWRAGADRGSLEIVQRSIQREIRLGLPGGLFGFSLQPRTFSRNPAGLQSVDLLEPSDPIRLVRIGERDGWLVSSRLLASDPIQLAWIGESDLARCHLVHQSRQAGWGP
jgi:hypothetical protein